MWVKTGAWAGPCVRTLTQLAWPLSCCLCQLFREGNCDWVGPACMDSPLTCRHVQHALCQPLRCHDVSWQASTQHGQAYGRL